MKIGVFDSGVGGQSVANAIQTALPHLEIILRDDREHLPYGLRPPAEILGFVEPILRSMVEEGCEAIVIACNTVSTTLIGTLRERFDIPLIGIEPMIKPAAAMTRSGVVAVCATPTTLASARYRQLKQEHAANVKVLEPDCSDWAAMIERNEVNGRVLGERISQALKAGADVIVLGCTHYHWIETEIAALAQGRARVIQPEPAIVERLKYVLANFVGE